MICERFHLAFALPFALRAQVEHFVGAPALPFDPDVRAPQSSQVPPYLVFLRHESLHQTRLRPGLPDGAIGSPQPLQLEAPIYAAALWSLGQYRWTVCLETAK
jgi:hypothetical protein